jgi:hypothetical protein
MKKVFVVMFMFLSLNVFAEQVETECAWSNDSESREVKQTKESAASSSSQSNSDASAQ